MKTQLRDMCAADAAALTAICIESGLSPWSEESFLSEATNPIAHYIVLEIDGVPAGFAGIWCVVDEAQVMNVAVDPPYQGRGLGRRLMEALLALARENRCTSMTLEVKSGNTVALDLYRSLGFEKTGIRRDYYLDHSDGILMALIGL